MISLNLSYSYKIECIIPYEIKNSFDRNKDIRQVLPKKVMSGGLIVGGDITEVARDELLALRGKNSYTRFL